jgi:leucyl-tRNA synthetase
MNFDKYICVMFPYPSGNGLHIGHFYNYAIIDSYCNYLRYKKESVFQPFGYDSFGLPAENYAKKIGGDPKKVTENNIVNFNNQMDHMNTSFDYLISTHSKEYQVHTKWLFNQLYEKGLAYKKQGIVNYCKSCETVLANEQVINNNCERCNSVIEKKELSQWYFKITDYKKRLIEGLNNLDYPGSTINAQKKWLENQHDWCVSRQRDWGCRIPVKGETDTLDTFVDSSFYYIIYCLVKGIKPKQVDLYVGGAEHACMHLIYARFINMFLYDIGYIDFEEPFKKVIHQGMILNNGEKMSKSKGNIVNPDDYNPKILRFYMMFIGHYFDGGSWSDENIKGIERFFKRFDLWTSKEGKDVIDLNKFKDEIFNYTDAFKFNKVVSSFMILFNKNKNKQLTREQNYELRNLLKIYTA